MTAGVARRPGPTVAVARAASWLAFTSDARIWAGGLFLLALAIRCYGLGAQSFWADEIAAVEIARQPLLVLFSDWMVRETNPPVYYALLHVWMGAFGEGEAAVRSLSAVAGALAVPLIFQLGRALDTRRTGVIAALLAAFWPHQVYYSQEARGYIFGVLGALVAVLGLVRIAERTCAPAEPRTAADQAWPWASYVGGVELALYVHTTHVVILLLANLYFAWLWAALSPRRLKPLIAWTVANALVVALWAWWGWITWRQLHLPHTNAGWIAKPSLSQGLSMVLTIDGPAGITLAKSTLRTALLGVGGLFAASAVFGWARLRLRWAVLLATFGLGAPMLLFLISQKVAIMLPRTLLWAEFAAILGLASALAAIRHFGLRSLVLAGVAVLLVIGGRLYDPKEPWRALTAELAARTTPGEVVLVSSVSDGVYLQHECEAAPCRFRIVDLASPTDDENRWAASIFKGEVIQPVELPALFAKRTFWTVSRWADDPRPAMARLHAVAIARARTPLPSFMDATGWRSP